MTKQIHTDLKNADAIPFAEHDTVIYRCLHQPGFGLRVGKRTKSWMCEFTVNRKCKRITLGRYPLISEDEARKRCSQIMQNLEAERRYSIKSRKTSSRKTPSLNLKDRRFNPAPKQNRLPAPKCTPGVYMLVKDDVIVYVGQSSNVEHRVATHASYEKQFTEYLMYKVPDYRLRVVLESALIKKHRPIFNATGHEGDPTVNEVRVLKEFDL